MSAGSAIALAKAKFASTLFARPLNAQMPQAGVRRTRSLDASSEVVSNTQTGRRSLMISSVPLSTRGPGGTQVPVNLAVKDTTSGYSPADPLVPVTVGKDLAEGVKFPGSGFGFQLEDSGSDAPIATPSGVFFANAGGLANGTDFVVNPIPAGVESFVQIRTASSPERYVLHFTLPAGASLAHAQSDHPIPGDPPTAIAIMQGGKALGYVYQPDAFDADGTQVPASAAIQGNNVVLTVARHGMDLHYPVLLDPVIATLDYFTSSGQGASDWAGWQWTQSDTWSVANPANCGASCPYTFGEAIDDPTYWPGLYTSMPTNNYFKPGDYALFYYNSPPGTYLGGAGFTGGHNAISTPFAPLGASNYILGLGNSSGWEANVSNYNGSSWQSGNPGAYGGPLASNTFLATCFTNCDGGTANSTAYMGIQAASSGSYIATGSHRDTVTASNSTVYLGDVNSPAISGSPASVPAWTNDGGKTYTTTAQFSDIGLGVASVSLVGAAGGTETFPSANACGDYYRNPCPGSRAAFPWTFTYTLPEGISHLAFTAADPTGRATTTTPTTVMIDRTPPSGVVLAAPWIRATAAISGTATDAPGPGANASSGVASATVQVQPAGGTWATVCAGLNATSGSFSCPWTTTGGSYPDGSYAVRAVITDNAGNTYTTPIVVTNVDNTPPDIELSGPLYEAANASIGSGAAQLGVDAIDGDDSTSTLPSGVVSVDLTVDGVDLDPSHDHVTQPCAAGDCELSASPTVDTSGLSAGGHQFEVTATDQAGNTATETWTAMVDPAQTIPTDPPSAPAASTPISSLSQIAANVLSLLQQAVAPLLAPSQAAQEPALVPETIAPALSAVAALSGDLGSMGSAAAADIPADPTTGFTLESDWGPLTFTPQNVDANAQRADVVDDSAAIYADTAPGADTVLRPTALGVATYTEIENASAPETYAWAANLSDDEALKQLPDGSVAVYAYTTPADAQMAPGSDATDAANTLGSLTPSPDDGPGAAQILAPPTWSGAPYSSSAMPVAVSGAAASLAATANADTQTQRSTAELSYAGHQFDEKTQWLVGVVAAPWAVDANGTSVPAALSVSGNVITLTIAHREGSYTYPVTADPDFIDCVQVDPCGTYNASAAATYAVHWRNSYNPQYLQFSNDCTNYLSQIFRAGGGQFMRAYQHGQGSWWMHDFLHGEVYDGQPPYLNQWDWTHSWSVSVSFVHQMLQYGLAKLVRGAYQPGDFLAFKWHSEPEITHLAFVAQVTNGHPYVLQHSNNLASPTSLAEYEKLAQAQGEWPYTMYHLRFVHTGANITS